MQRVWYVWFKFSRPPASYATYTVQLFITTCFVQTKTKALAKADQITAHVGYAKEILDDDLLEEFYQENICYSTFGTWTLDIHIDSSFV